MPRGKGGRRFAAARRRAESPAGQFPPGSCHGTGTRHRVRTWPIGKSGRQHQLVIPVESPNKQFALLIGNSHLRAVVDGYVPMPESRFSFGISATPGGRARDIRTELAATELDRVPDVVVVMATGNGLTAHQTVHQAAEEFGQLLDHVCRRWPTVCVLDFPPRLSVDAEIQSLLRDEYRRVSAARGLRYITVAEHFPLTRRELWAWDG
ncbi:uncharacterized protein, partial [Brachionichthys hirsutus]|uniref:uncharacterized protein n=1 Tax=Brachionichthys hirsutus TaxID=412623 RepID=UPI0036048426